MLFVPEIFNFFFAALLRPVSALRTAAAAAATGSVAFRRMGYDTSRARRDLAEFFDHTLHGRPLARRVAVERGPDRRKMLGRGAAAAADNARAGIAGEAGIASHHL